MCWIFEKLVGMRTVKDRVNLVFEKVEKEETAENRGRKKGRERWRGITWETARERSEREGWIIEEIQKKEEKMEELEKLYSEMAKRKEERELEFFFTVYQEKKHQKQ